MDGREPLDIELVYKHIAELRRSRSKGVRDYLPTLMLSAMMSILPLDERCVRYSSCLCIYLNHTEYDIDCVDM